MTQRYERVSIDGFTPTRFVEHDSWRGLQDGMLAYYLNVAGASDVNVEARLEKEPFDYRAAMTHGHIR